MPNRLLRDVILALAAKLLALTAIYLLFFDGAHQPLLTPSTVASQILGDSTHANQR
jgi:hypothetical protein